MKNPHKAKALEEILKWASGGMAEGMKARHMKPPEVIAGDEAEECCDECQGKGCDKCTGDEGEEGLSGVLKKLSPEQLSSLLKK